ncbi:MULTISPECIES: hypothetical protein [unclassified Microcoleus]|uniref:hypothetical protein n=1 Tax=unclassified Microcoleus TaxID=2642155 RepID=UPI002FD5793C
MTVESQVSISFVVSLFSDEIYNPDDDRLNYESYEKLGLICGKCRELIFFKKGTERVSHFSHFKTTGKDCQWRTGSDSNTLHTDAEGREQSLERFQAKFKSIIEQGIIKHQQISSSQLREQIKEGQKLVSTYKIDIDYWLRWFNQNRKLLRNLAKSLYQTNELVSEENQIILLNFVDYLCVPASEYILKDILYYVFGLLDKEISLKKYLEELPSKVIELMSYAEWKKEYQRAKEFVVHSKFEQNAHSDFVNSPVEVKGFVHPNIKPEESIRNDDGSITISKEVKTLLTPKAQLTNLSNWKSVAKNSLEWCGMLANVPCRVTLVNSKDHWQLEALPIKDVPTFPLLYCLANKAIEGYWQEEDLDNLIVIPLDKEMEKLENLANKTQDPIKVEKIGRRVTNLQKLRKAVLNREKLDAKVLAECTDIVKKAISEASYRPSITDPYYSRYILGQVYFVSKNESEITYLLDDYMSHSRKATQVISAVQWLSRVPNNLQKEFPKQKPTIEQLRKYLCDKFNGRFREVELKVREEGKKILLDIIYLNKVQVTQLLTIKMPATEGKNRGKVSVKVNGTPNFSERSVFEKFLRTKDGRFVAEAQNQLRHLVNVFLSRNFNTLVGEGKVGHQRKVSEIIGFERSTKGWSEIKNGFVKNLLPYSTDSEVKAGKLVYLATNQVLSSQDLEHLIIQIAENWSNWCRKDQQRIKIGVSSGKSTDPQSLVWVLTQKILTGNFEEDKEAWQDTINWFAEICKSSDKYKAVGFRCNNGVILTPDCIYDTDVDKWMHRIKIQLIDLLLESDAGNIESWLQKSPEYLYETLEKIRPDWELTSKDISKHLEAMHDALNISIKVESSLQ